MSNRIPFSDSQKAEAIRRYEAGEAYHRIAPDFGVHQNTMRRRLREWGIKRRPPMHVRCAVDLDKDAVIKAYEELNNTYAVAKKFGVGPNPIRHRLNSWGIDTPRRPNLPINENAFDELTPEALYWLGYLVADGNLHGTTNQISLSSKDMDQIKKYKRFLGSEHSLRVQPKPEYNTELYCLAFSSRHMKSVLESYGLTPNKSFTAGREIVDSRILYSRDYWRGVIDGDGMLSLRGRYPVLGLTSASQYMVNQFEDFLGAYGLPLCNVYFTNRLVYQCSHNGKKAVRVSNFLYLRADTYLDRKYRIALEFSKRYQQGGDAECPS